MEKGREASTSRRTSLLRLLQVSAIVGSCSSFAPVPPLSGAGNVNKARRDVSSLSSSVLCNGEILYDLIALPSAAGWPMERVVTEKAYTAYPGGAPANVATALKKLGSESAFAGAVGDDEEGRQLLRLLEDIGVGTELCRVTDAPTRTVLVTRDEHGERTFAGFGHDGQGVSGSFADCEEGGMGSLSRTSVLVQGTLGLACSRSRDHMHALKDKVQQQGGKTLVDVNWRPVFWAGYADDAARASIRGFARDADIVKLTDEEAEWMFGVSAQEVMAKPSQLREYFPQAQCILLTGGSKGASYDILGKEGFVPVFPVKVKEVSDLYYYYSLSLSLSLSL
jgi:fructokinase